VLGIAHTEFLALSDVHTVRRLGELGNFEKVCQTLHHYILMNHSTVKIGPIGLKTGTECTCRSADLQGGSAASSSA
jgi:hypothetical protein